MRYLTEKITDEEIDRFEQEEYVVITSPTGSGKTTLVLRKLLPRAVDKGKHIVYVCNRSILKDQVEVSAEKSLKEIFGDVDMMTEEEKNLIHIVTYQYCETQGNINRIKIAGTDITLTPGNVLYYIFDEAHYFLNDSLFNPGTHFWTRKGCFSEIGTKIFMTATPEPLRWFLSAVIPWNWEEIEQVRKYNSFLSIYELYKQICDKTEEKGKRKRELMDNQASIKVQISYKDTSRPAVYLGNKEEKHYSDRYIWDECRKIEIFSGTLKIMQEQIQKVQQYYTMLPKEPFESNTESFIEFYYYDEDFLISAIKEAPKSEKWLIFIDASDDGIELETKLDSLGISAVFLSRKTITKKAKAKDQYNQIVEEGKFSCQVLVATSVMDCGVSITDPAVKHIAVSQSDKVTFLQMLGRRRLSDGETVRIYIKQFSVKQIQGVKHKYETKAILMSQYGLINDAKVWHVGKTRITYRDHFGQEKVDRICNEITTPENYALTYFVKGESKNDGSSEITDIRSNNITAFIALLYLICELTAALEEYDDNLDPQFYLKRQLGWIGKTYNMERWLGYLSNLEKLNQLLQDNLDRMLTKENQNEFSIAFFQTAMSMPIPPSKLLANRSRFESGPNQPQKGPGRNLINRTLEELDLSFFIASKRHKKKTVWVVTRKE